MPKPLQRRIQSPRNILKGLFLILRKGFRSLCNVTRSSMLVVVGVLHLPLHFIIIIVIIAIIIVINMLILLISLVYITRSSGRAQESWQNSGFQTLMTYKAQWKNLTVFLNLLGTITGSLLLLSLIYLFIYSFLVLINFF